MEPYDERQHTDPSEPQPRPTWQARPQRVSSQARRNMYRMKQSRNSDRSMYVYFGALGAVAAVILVIRYGPALFGASVDSQIADECAAINKTLPRTIDQFTRLDLVESFPGKRIRYTATISG